MVVHRSSTASLHLRSTAGKAPTPLTPDFSFAGWEADVIYIFAGSNKRFESHSLHATSMSIKCDGLAVETIVLGRTDKGVTRN